MFPHKSKCRISGPVTDKSPKIQAGGDLCGRALWQVPIYKKCPWPLLKSSLVMEVLNIHFLLCHVICHVYSRKLMGQDWGVCRNATLDVFFLLTLFLLTPLSLDTPFSWHPFLCFLLTSLSLGTPWSWHLFFLEVSSLIAPFSWHVSFLDIRFSWNIFFLALLNLDTKFSWQRFLSTACSWHPAFSTSSYWHPFFLAFRSSTSFSSSVLTMLR